VRAAAICLLIAAGCLGGCAYLPPLFLARPWLIGVERMVNDPALALPFTNRFIADLSAMPNTQVVFLNTYQNAFLFESWRGNKLRVVTWLRGERACMSITYWITQSGLTQSALGMVVPPLPAGLETDAACVDRAATDFYASLVVMGL
jgi:hypothetical protein